MLDWFRSRPKPPIDTWHKAWTESRMLWLAEQLGGDRILRAKVLHPVPEDFPAVDARTDDGARRLMEYLCEVMEVDPRKVELEVVEDQQMPRCRGPSRRPRVGQDRHPHRPLAGWPSSRAWWRPSRMSWPASCCWAGGC